MRNSAYLQKNGQVKRVFNKQNVLLFILVIGLIMGPLVYQQDAEFGGADDQVQNVIGAIRPEYSPWMESPWLPPSGEIESLLFSAQAAIGAGVIGYILGYLKGKNKEDLRQVAP